MVNATPEPALATTALMRLAAQALDRCIDARLRHHDLTHMQWRLLELLKQTGDLASGALAAWLSMDTGAATRLLDRLEAKGLCVRRRGHADRRSVMVLLTEAGRLRLEHASGVVTSAIADCFAGMEAGDLAVLCQGLRHILRSGTGRSAP
jgi:DNA-binding MarR family transcriptional regulator